MKKAIIIVLILLAVVACFFIFAKQSIANNALKVLYPKSYSEIVELKAEEFSLDENLIYAVIRAESGFREEVSSYAGAHGLMQLTDQTFEWISSMYPPDNGGNDIFDPLDNIHCGSALLRRLINYYGELDTALSAYNAGIGNVDSWLQNPLYSKDGKTLIKIPFSETEEYVKRVNENLSIYKKIY